MYLPSGPEQVFAIATRPTVPPNGVAVLCLHSGAQIQTYHRNRMFTRLCREVAGFGCMALRMDYHGSGDSSGVLLDQGIVGQTADDVSAAVRWLSDQGVTRIMAVGTCWGALVALVTAASEEAIVSLCLISPPLALITTGASATKPRGQREPLGRALSHGFRPGVIRLLLVEREYRRWVLHRIRRRAQQALARRGWISPPRADDHVQLSPLVPLMRRGVRVHALYGEDDKSYRNLKRRGGLPSLGSASEIIDITTTSVDAHTLTSLEAQERAILHVRDCLARDFGVTVTGPAPECDASVSA